jgi:hypothetical protein
LQSTNTLKNPTKILAGFEPIIYCYWGGYGSAEQRRQGKVLLGVLLNKDLDRCLGGEEIGAMGREIESRQGMGW